MASVNIRALNAADLITLLRQQNVADCICNAIAADGYTGLDFAGATFVEDAFDDQTKAQHNIKKPHLNSLVEIRNRLLGSGSSAPAPAPPPAIDTSVNTNNSNNANNSNSNNNNDDSDDLMSSPSSGLLQQEHSTARHGGRQKPQQIESLAARRTSLQAQAQQQQQQQQEANNNSNNNNNQSDTTTNAPATVIIKPEDARARLDLEATLSQQPTDFAQHNNSQPGTIMFSARQREENLRAFHAPLHELPCLHSVDNIRAALEQNPGGATRSEINLVNLNLVGTVNFPAINSTVKTFNVAQNPRLGGAADLSRLPFSLTKLDLSDCSFSGTFAMSMLPMMTEFVSLRGCTGMTNAEDAPLDLRGPVRLQVLDLSHCSFRGTLNLTSLPLHIRVFNLSHNQFRGPCDLHAFAACEKLEEADVSHNRLVASDPTVFDLTRLATATKLKKLDFSHNLFNFERVMLGGEQHNSALPPPGLVYLDISHNPIRGPEPLVPSSFSDRCLFDATSCAFTGPALGQTVNINNATQLRNQPANAAFNPNAASAGSSINNNVSGGSSDNRASYLSINSVVIGGAQQQQQLQQQRQASQQSSQQPSQNPTPRSATNNNQSNQSRSATNPVIAAMRRHSDPDVQAVIEKNSLAKFIIHPDAVEMLKNLGQGGLGCTHLARLMPDERFCAAKRFRENGKHREILLHVEKLLQLPRHRNVAELIGVTVKNSLGPDTSNNNSSDKADNEVVLLSELGEIDLEEVLQQNFPAATTQTTTATATAGGNNNNSNTPLTWDQWIELLAGAAEGLLFLHNHGILVESMHPRQLVLFNGRTVLKICEPGFNRAAQNVADSNVMRAGISAVKWYSPESLHDSKVIEAGDVFSLGAVMSWIVSGAEPFGSKKLSLPQFMMSTMLSQVKPREGCPEWLAELTRRCVDPDPSKRPTSRELLQVFWEKTNRVAPAAANVSDALPSFLEALEQRHLQQQQHDDEQQQQHGDDSNASSVSGSGGGGVALGAGNPVDYNSNSFCRTK